MAKFKTLTTKVSRGIGRLTLNQPDNLNPLGTNTLAELAQAARWFDERGTVVVIVTGAGDRAFSSGFDLREFSNPDRDAPDGGELGYQMADALENMDAVTIAAVHGHCVGGGVVLVGACDLRIAADNTRFSIPEVDLGIPLAWGGIPRLVREIGPALTRELVMTCRPFDADEARAAGFVNRVVPRADLESAATELANELLKKAPWVLKTVKRQVQEASENMASTKGGWTGSNLIAVGLIDPGARAAAKAYLESRGH